MDGTSLSNYKRILILSKYMSRKGIHLRNRAGYGGVHAVDLPLVLSGLSLACHVDSTISLSQRRSFDLLQNAPIPPSHNSVDGKQCSPNCSA
jgi:hypothetical protein